MGQGAVEDGARFLATAFTASAALGMSAAVVTAADAVLVVATGLDLARATRTARRACNVIGTAGAVEPTTREQTHESVLLVYGFGLGSGWGSFFDRGKGEGRGVMAVSGSGYGDGAGDGFGCGPSHGDGHGFGSGNANTREDL